MIILLSPLIPQDEEYLLWGDSEKEYDLRFPLWYPDKPGKYLVASNDVHIIFYTVSLIDDDVEGVQLVDNLLILSTSRRTAPFPWVFGQLESYLLDRFVADFIVHLPKYHFILTEKLVDICNGTGKHVPDIDPGLFFYRSTLGTETFNYVIECPRLRDLGDMTETACFSIEPDVDTQDSIHRKIAVFRERCPNGAFLSGREVVSLGGWCGPAEALRMLGIRNQALPFDYIHSSMEGINMILDGMESAFFPLPGESRTPFMLFPHHDLQDKAIVKTFKKRFVRLQRMLVAEKPILFIRTVVNQDFQEELEQVQTFLQILRVKHHRTNDRVVLIFHDQQVGTVQLGPIAGNVMAWSAQGEVGWNVPNRDLIFCSYMKIISSALQEKNWPPQQQINAHMLRNHQSIGIVKTLFDPRPGKRSEMAISWPGSKNELTKAVTKSSIVPVLIGGCPCSGVQLMGSILASHPFVYRVKSIETGGISTANNKQTTTLGRIFEEQINRLPEHYSHWCEASPANIMYTDEIIEILDGVRIINIVRDVRDVVLSSASAQDGRPEGVTVERWLEYISAGRKVEKYPQVMTIRYEDLIAHYDDVMEYVCQFIGLEPVAELFQFPVSRAKESQLEWYMQRNICDDCSHAGGWRSTAPNPIVLTALQYPGIKAMLEYYSYLPRKRQIILSRIKRSLRRFSDYIKFNHS